MCTYYPHLSLKDKSLYDLLEFTNKPKDAVYVLQCAAGLETNYIEDNDFATHHIKDWKIEDTCINPTKIGFAEETWGPGIILN